ncbi:MULTISPECIES: fatty acid--CoA ligase family protein [unclassified Pseudomonas]|uniref:ANL family adenylate-forming protein n=1 Tax=unclassified Pseudomonas TaxID=196821 RepID=UPI000884E0B8|nr:MULTISPECIES: fatty acid--CoA ligase family protein [unclassified Pseudomonas]SCY95828.1 Acyl-CoA synthetase (AMP-forming)/AMP-acid ligase II [Pseudomonas sp. NFACC37-1]SFO54244.1 Acyl-CoA synthetase (AMP-forming)/AMP-acid ligase II [Pseudomonas sp. NFACC24-1]
MSRDALLATLAEPGQRVALLHGEQQCTYNDLHAKVQQCLAWLVDHGVKPGDAVILNSDYSVPGVAALLALYLNRNIVAPLVDLSERSLQTLQGAARCQYRIEIVADAWVHHSLAQPVADESPEYYSALREKGRSGLVLLSSGSTGAPKAILHDLDDLIDTKLGKERKKPLSILMFLLFDHIGGLNSLLNTLAVGGCAVMPVDRAPESICALVARHGVKVLPVSPTFLNLILMGRHHEQHDLSSVRLITYGTESMQQSLLKRVQQAFPKAKMLQTFGTSETGISATVSQSSASTFFKLADANTQYRIVDGELQLKTRSQFVGYLNQDTDNVTEDGWFRTGDLVEQNEEGYLRIQGRQKELINVGGLKVLPTEIEDVMLRSSLIDDCVVYGVPNAITGQAVHMDVMAAGVESKKALKQHVLEHLGSCLEAYKLPVKVNKVDEIAFSNRFKKTRAVLS